MTKLLAGLVGGLGLIALTAVGCSSTPAMTVASVAVTSGIGLTNEPMNSLTEIPVSQPVIYLTAEVANPAGSIPVQVRWFKLPTTVLATEDFSGRRSDSSPFDFDRTKSVSTLASRLERQDIGWEVGEYRAEVWLGGRLAKTIFFKVVSDTEADRLNAARVVQQIAFSDQLTSTGELGTTATSFSRSTNVIYVQLTIGQSAPSATIVVMVRYVAADQSVASFTAVPQGTAPLRFELSRERFGRLWSDKLWPIGTFEVKVEINGILARTRTFQIVF